ncbi:hypothetical protein [Leeuwenhoekiella sp. H156]|uniref:hypothetical protein n=1 Tax=Leeuwenhoekiella sp. H156 TaxID=3450128 RepID=UPI003FA49B14
MITIIKYLSILPLVFFLACEDSFEPAGIETRVFGRVYDDANELPIANQKLLVSEWNSVPQFSPGPNDDFVQYLDSTYTDINGYYELTFTTTGKGDLYFLEYEYDESYWNFYQSRVEIQNLGTDTTEVNYNFLHLYPVNLRITLAPDVENLPIRISPYFTNFRSTDWLTEVDKQYTRTILTDKNREERIRFIRTKSDGKNYQEFNYSLPATNTTELTEFEIYISNDDFVDF